MPIARTLTAVLLLLGAAAPGVPAAEPLVIKLATLAPQGSDWHRTLQELGEQWRTASQGQVALRLYAGGVAGDEADVMRKLQLGTLHAAALTSTGLAEVDRSVLALQIPLAYADYGEFDCVLAKLGPELERRLASKGLVVLAWSDAGWVHFFSKAPIRTPDDLRAAKLFSWSGDDEYTELWRNAGFRPIPLPATEVATALQTGLVNAAPTTPEAALLMQWSSHVKQMSDLKWAVLLGALVIDQTAWGKIPAALRPALAEAARATGRRLSAMSRRAAEQAVEALRKRGLTVVHVEEAALAEWRTLLESKHPKIRGAFLPADIMDAALAQRDECRRRAREAGGS